MAEINKDKKEETVVVKKDALENILKDIADLKEKNKTLEAVADKSRLAWYEGTKPASQKLSSVTVGTYPTKDGYKTILGWSSMPLNEMYQDSNGVFHERQTVELMLEGNEKLLVNYIDFPRRKVSVRANVIGRSRDESTGIETLKVEMVEGKKLYEIDACFINV